jgi:hypothetical protein
MLAMLQRVSEDSFLMTALMTALMTSLMTSDSVSDAATRERGPLSDGLSEYRSDGLSEYLCDGLSDRLPDACMQVSDGISHPKLRETVSLIAPLIASDDLADELADGVALSLFLSRVSLRGRWRCCNLTFTNMGSRAA